MVEVSQLLPLLPFISLPICPYRSTFSSHSMPYNRCLESVVKWAKQENNFEATGRSKESSMRISTVQCLWLYFVLPVLHRQVPKRSWRDVNSIERKMKVKRKMKSIRSLNYSIACTGSQEATVEASSCTLVMFTRWETEEYTHSVVLSEQNKNITDDADNR
jgi:hypothetical protein